MSMPGWMRQNKSGQTAMKRMSATQSAMSRIAWFTPKISWISTTTPVGLAFGSATYAEKLPEPSLAWTVMDAMIGSSLLIPAC